MRRKGLVAVAVAGGMVMVMVMIGPLLASYGRVLCGLRGGSMAGG